MPQTAPPRDLVARLVPGDVVVVEGPVEARDDDLWPEEARSVVRAVATRRHEFATGRRFARRALERLGVSPAPLPVGDDRAPQWPHGVVGSITHSAAYCAAAVADAAAIGAIGIDVEDVDRFQSDVVDLVLTPREIATLLAGNDAGERQRRGAAAFSAKESLYKSLAGVNAPLDFQDADVAFDDDTGVFRATLHAAVAPYAVEHVFTGRFAFAGSLVATALVVRR